MTHPITPPPELVEQWDNKAATAEMPDQLYIATQAARWGADQELEACCKLLELSDTNAREFLYTARRPKPQLVALADVHYEWELEDAAGEWQAGGSANSLNDVRREGMRYLQTYAQDGAHKLIIRQHCTETIDEITNG